MSMNRLRTDHTPRDRFSGQAMVEFAIVASIFFSLIFGVIEGGRLLFTYHQVNHGAREGARYAVANGDKSGNVGSSEIQNYITEQTTGLNESAMTVQVSSPNGNGPREPVTVTVNYQFDPIVGLVFGTNPIALSADSTMLYHY